MEWMKPKNKKKNVDERIGKSKAIFKEMPPAPPPTLFPSSTQSSSNPDNVQLYSQMSQEELDRETHKIVMSMFEFTRSLARAINRGRDEKELEKYIIQETIREVEYLLKEMNKKIYFFYNLVHSFKKIVLVIFFLFLSFPLVWL